MAERSYYGDVRIKQGGSWPHLYMALKHVFIGVAILFLSLGFFSWGYSGLGKAIIFVGSVWVAIGYVHYQVHSFAYMMSHKQLGDDVSFKAEPRTGAVIRLYCIAAIGMGMVATLLFLIVQAVMPGFIMSIGAIGVISIVVVYFLVFLVLQAMLMVMLTQPVLEHFIETFSIVNPEPLNQIHQRQADAGVGAEGVGVFQDSWHYFSV